MSTDSSGVVTRARVQNVNVDMQAMLLKHASERATWARQPKRPERRWATSQSASELRPPSHLLLLTELGRTVSPDSFSLSLSAATRAAHFLSSSPRPFISSTSINTMANKLSQPTVPYSEAPWIQGLPSSIFTDPSHIRLREWARKWVEDVLFPATAKYEAADRVTDNEAYARAAKDGLLLPFGVGVKIPQKLVDLAGGIQLPAGIKASEWNNIHDYILWDEFNRVASAGAVMGLFGGLSYGAGPIIHFASEEQQKRWLPEIFTGKKRICLAITEPLAGSNVANLSTSATLSECGKYYIVNGGKKWITNGVYSDYFTTAVRTSGKPGDPTGVTLLVIPRGEGVTTKSMKMMGGGGSGTTLVEFDVSTAHRSHLRCSSLFTDSCTHVPP